METLKNKKLTKLFFNFNSLRINFNLDLFGSAKSCSTSSAGGDVRYSRDSFVSMVIYTHTFLL